MSGQTAKWALALGLGAVAGFIANLAGLPLPWMLGPMIINTFAALIKAPIGAPIPFRPIVIPIIGVMLGSGVTPEVLGLVSDWVVSFLVLPPFLAVAAGLSYLFYRRIGGYDVPTAYFAAMPGGLNEMVLLGEENGGDAKRIALAHASRVLLVVSFVALFFGLVLGVSSADQGGTRWVAMGALSVLDYVVLAACAVVGHFLGRWLRLPAGGLLGPLILSGTAHFYHVVDVPPPSLLVIIAQIVMGTIIGCRFVGSQAQEILRDLLLGAFATLGMLATGVGFAALVAALTDTDLLQAFLAYSPGGLTEMSLLAFALGGDIAYVSLTHVVRITIVVFAAPIAMRLLRADQSR